MKNELYIGLDVHKETIAVAERVRNGEVTKCGNPHARWLLVECAQHYANPTKVGKELSKRQEGQSRQVKEVSWRAQNRLHLRFKKLMGRKLQRNKTLIAVARELTGFIWELLHNLDCYTTENEIQKSAA